MSLSSIIVCLCPRNTPPPLVWGERILMLLTMPFFLFSISRFMSFFNASREALKSNFSPDGWFISRVCLVMFTQISSSIHLHSISIWLLNVVNSYTLDIYPTNGWTICAATDCTNSEFKYFYCHIKSVLQILYIFYISHFSLHTYTNSTNHHNINHLFSVRKSVEKKLPTLSISV